MYSYSNVTVAAVLCRYWGRCILPILRGIFQESHCHDGLWPLTCWIDPGGETHAILTGSWIFLNVITLGNWQWQRELPCINMSSSSNGSICSCLRAACCVHDSARRASSWAYEGSMKVSLHRRSSSSTGVHAVPECPRSIARILSMLL